jgi:OOP family OmpA-OmpF porin
MACSTLSNNERNTTLDNPFADALRQGYIDLADFEREQGDLGDGFWYEHKVSALFDGKLPEPTSLENRDIPTEYLNELASARNGLMTAISQGAAKTKPAELAAAQTSYDCWVEQQEENFQPDHIAACRDRFKTAFAKLGAALEEVEIATPAPVREKAQKEAPVGAFIVFFNYDSSRLSAGAMNALDEVVRAAKKLDPKMILVSGHADRRGNAGYNQKLSEKRAEAVQAYLTSRGLSADQVIVRGFGENKPRVATADGVAEPGNRFVKIGFTK